MNSKTNFIELSFIYLISISSVLPVIQAIAALLTILVGLRQVIRGVRKEGGFFRYLKSFFVKNQRSY